MSNLGTEVGVKMRCAVKAKLIELGSGGTAGYIDDELPDYVMIMVANKRSKQQMIEDLNLFLGSNTDTFVSWLHQVLEKLQEVTLPQTAKGKRKSSETGEATSKKDKKEKKREKRLKRSAKETGSTEQPTVAEAVITPPVPSITDVFADHLVQKAKRSIAAEKSLSLKAKKESMDKQKQPEQSSTPPPTPPPPIMPSNVEGNGPEETPIEVTDGFDIPTISEIAEGAVELKRKQKELEELADIQKKIYLAKNQLKSMCDEESEDEDFINLKANEDEDFDIEEGKKQQQLRNRQEQEDRRAKRKPITFEEPAVEEDEDEDEEEGSYSPLTSPPQAKKSVLDRLGGKQAAEKEEQKPTNKNIISLSAHRKVERELYVPTFRRTKEYEAQRQQKQQEKEEAERVRKSIHDRMRERQRERDRELERQREREQRQKPKSRDRSERSIQEKPQEEPKRQKLMAELLPDSSTQDAPRSREKQSVRQRIGSRVFVIPPKPEVESVEVPVNSVVKITPRPNRPINKLACKNLLLRAVAEAQKSTANIPIKATKDNTVMPKKIISQSAKSRLGLELRPRQKQLIIEIASASDNKSVSKRDEPKFQIEIQNRDDDDDVVEEIEEVEATTIEVVDSPGEEEYVPEPVMTVSKSDSDSDYIYIPKSKDGATDYEAEVAKNTQFVVTLDGVFGKKTAGAKPKVVLEKKRRHQTPEVPRKSVKDRIGYKTKSRSERRSRSPRKLSPQKFSQKSRTPPRTREKALDRHSSTRRRSRSRSPIQKNDYSPDTTTSTRDEPEKEHSKTPERSLTPPLRKPQHEKIVVAPPQPSSEISFHRKVSPINFNLTDDEHHSSDGEHGSPHKLRSATVKRDSNGSKDGGDYRFTDKTVKKLESSGKFDNLPPLLSSVTIPTEKSSIGGKKLIKSIERCKYFPGCRQGESCEFLHPTKPCKAFPNCKFGETCQYLHPICKFNKVCARPDCNYMHTAASSVLGGSMITTAPPLASSVVPVQNYKSITSQPLPPLCKFYPKCTNVGCLFYHPKPCKYGKNCPYKIECNFFHFDLPSYDKLKWISPSV